MAFRGKKTQIYVTDEQWRELARESGADGMSVASVIRRAIDEHLNSNKSDRTGFEKMLSDTAGVWGERRDIGSTEEFVRQLRKGWSSREERMNGGRVSD